MRKLKKYFFKIKSFCIEWNRFNFIIAFSNLIWPFLNLTPQKWATYLMKKKHLAVEKYIYSRYNNQIISFLEKGKEKVLDNSVLPIWVCWLQGEGQMPEIPRICLHAIRKQAAGHPVIVISLDNYQQFISIPNYIIQKWNSGFIRPAHFADIIRTCLLYECGGVWIDATILVTKELPEILFSSPFYSAKFPNDGYFITECKWSNFFLCSQKRGITFEFTRMLFFEYLKNEDYFIDYFMMDYFIRIGYESNPEIKKQIDEVPFNNEQIHLLGTVLNQPYTEELLSSMQKNTYLFKLSWKSKVIDKINNKDTFWGFLKDTILD